MATIADDVMLTTIDNPYNPFTHYDEWYRFDEDYGYHSTGLLARITISSDALSEQEEEQAIVDAIDEIVRENVSGMHRRVYRNDSRSGE